MQVKQKMTFMIGVLVSLTLIVLLCVAQWFKYADIGASAETSIKYSWENNRQILGQYTIKVSEAAQIQKRYSDDLSKLMEKALTSRYGEEGSKATWQFIKEQNGNLSPEIYKNVMQIIEAGRTKFENSQTDLLERKRSYETLTIKPWSKFWLGLADYPTEGFFEKYNVITSESAKQQFETGVATEVIF